MEINNFDAITFDIGNKKHIQVYYQTKDKAIQETSYESGANWFVSKTNIVAENAGTKSPITVTRWVVNNVVQIRLYYVNDKREIKFRKAQNKWTLQNTSITGAGEGVRFAAVSAGKTGTVHLYYQGITQYLMAAVWDVDGGNWKPCEC